MPKVARRLGGRMTDVGRLSAWFASGNLLRPGPPAPNTVDLARALALLQGSAQVEAGEGARRLASVIGPAQHYILCLVDGLGMETLESLPAGCFLRRNLKEELRSVFPSSTAPAITALATGLWPAQHAVPTWFVYLRARRVTAIILPFVSRFEERDLVEAGVGIREALPAPPLMNSYRTDTMVVQPRTIADSVYTRYLAAGRERAGYARLTEAVTLVAERVRNAPAPTYTYLYVPDVDVAAHDYGPLSEAALARAAEVDAQLALLAEVLGGRARIVVSADHGAMEPAPGDRDVLAEGDPLLGLLEVPPSGEPRVPVFHCRRRGDVGRFAYEFRQRFGERWALLTPDEVESLGLLGPSPLAANTRERLGDFIAVSGRNEVMLYGPDEKTGAMVGFHGGMTAAEMRVPLVIA